ncbi:zinc finger protein Xfin-like [Contarinia nasturtii]|uniref:zinc finger protein Xfin-like n=1 Tax=Contarinia nasturtii TaxID=265458 RepID=UPI0012D4A2D7|nr:zinc finger protein Xfin-like [Contarinia nasturtii]
MENVCRLCGCKKTGRQLMHSIDDQSIEQKLIDCCRWKSKCETYNLPRKICNSCSKNLEKCWEFAEKVAQTQQNLLAQIANTKPTTLSSYTKYDFDQKEMKKETIENMDDFEQNLSVNDVELNELKEDLKISYTENVDDFEQNLSVNDIKDIVDVAMSPTVPFDYDDDFHGTMSEENYSEPSTIEDAKPSLSDIQSMDETPNKKHKFDIRLLSVADKNDDGTVKRAKILELGLHDWSEIKLRCCMCPETFETYYTLRLHYDQNHNPQSKLRVLCQFCDAPFVGRSVLMHVRRVHLPYLEYCCRRCNMFYWDLDALKKHQNGKHTKPKPENRISHLCEMCGKSCGGRAELRQHKRSHLPIEQRRTFECYVCKSKYTYRKSLIRHMEPAHFHRSVKQFQCEVCAFQFKRAYALRRHLMIHSGEHPYTCHCGKSFRTNYHLKVHERTHTGEKPYACSFCEYRCSAGENMTKHIKQRHKNHLQKK